MRERLQHVPSFHETFLEKAVDCLLASDVDTCKSLLLLHANATIGFGELGGLTRKSPTSDAPQSPFSESELLAMNNPLNSLHRD